MKDIVKPIVVLTVICLVVTALLAYVNTVTSPIIEAAEQKSAEEARSEVLSKADSFEKLDPKGLPENVSEVYKGSKDSGYVVIVTEKGYGGTIKLIVGLHADGSIEAVKTLLHSETNGIGSKVVDNGSGYRENFSGKTKETYESVDSVTGATISSKAYKRALNTVFETYEIIRKEAAQK